MRLAFVVGDARAQRPGWATAYLALAAARRGHDVCFVDVDDLTLTADDQVLGLARRPAGPCRDNAGLCAALADERDPAVEERLSGFDLVFLRHHPTREGARPGGGGPAIDFGLRLRQGGVLVVNDPEGVRRAGGRMYLSGLPPAECD
jgi:glutathione synthase/RimK-type ligase-like ATP-grasp enzyme